MNSRNEDAREAVVLVHGLWMSGLDMVLLRRRLGHAGFRTWQFRYPSVRRSAPENARALADFGARVDAPVVHYVGHSLGGLVLLYLFRLYPPSRPGRVVLLGTPVSGSAGARGLRQRPGGRWLLGRSFRGALDGDVPAWSGQRELGVIAGTFGLGAAGLLGDRLPRPHDGTVAVAETELAGASDRLTFHASHMGLLLAPAVAEAVACFLRRGRFPPPR